MILFHHPSSLQHDTGSGHPECPARIETILSVLREVPGIDWREAPAASHEQLLRVHPEAHIEQIFAALPNAGTIYLDGDTVLSPASGEAALHAAGGACAAVDAVLADEAKTAFCALRPPGHHAEPDRSMGFCLFNNAAVAAQHARAAHGLRRVAVFDWDVHHGNGTQAAFENEADLMYISTHQSPLYPGTGYPQERGIAENILNVTLAAHSGPAEIRHVWSHMIEPQLRDFAPDLLLISAGFDAHHRDPLANLNLRETDYAWLTRKCRAVADDCCQGRLVSILEGGYHLEALATSVAVHVEVLLEDR